LQLRELKLPLGSSSPLPACKDSMDAIAAHDIADLDLDTGFANQPTTCASSAFEAHGSCGAALLGGRGL